MKWIHNTANLWKKNQIWKNVKTLFYFLRLGEAVKSAEKEGKSDQALAVNQSKKLDFMHEKEKQYKTSLDKEEILLHKTTGGK